MGIERTILYVWRPEFAEQVDLVPHDVLCYHIDDEYSFSPDKDVPTSGDELALLRRADLVFIHSRTLLAKKGHINPNTHCVPNGVDFDVYRAAMESSDPEPEDLRSIPHPRIGYVGYIKRHLDLPLLLKLAQQRRDWSCVLVGPVRDQHHDIASDVAALRHEPNVHFLGAKPARDLPLYTKGFDVCLMPYRQTNYTRYIYPLKLHEYLACGKPVVATPLENLREFGSVLRFAETSREWEAAVTESLGDTGSSACARRIAVAEDNGWTKRVEQIEGALRTALMME
jgi:glycosyltransferase involved in cell wall biosynthesis